MRKRCKKREKENLIKNEKSANAVFVTGKWITKNKLFKKKNQTVSMSKCHW